MIESDFKEFLELLSPDEERAAEIYLHLQGKLIRYFGWNSCATPEELTDEVIDRVCRRVKEGERIEMPVSYVLGVARRVLLEVKTKSLLPPLPLEADIADPKPVEVTDPTLDCLERCLSKLPPETRAMLLEYYSADSSSRVGVRQHMADRMGLSVNSLRNRVLRLRRNLEVCIEGCRKGESQ